VSDLDKHSFELLGLLHKAPGSGAAWGRFLDALRAAISPDAVAVFAAQPRKDQPGLLAGSGLGVMSVHLGDFLRPSVPHPSAPEVPLGAVGEIRANSPGIRASGLFREALEPAGVLPGPALFVVTERNARHILSAVLILPIASHWKPTADDRALLERLAPHMVLARRLHRRLAERSRDSEAVLAAFDQLVLCVVFLDDRMRVSYANQSAAELLGVKAGFAPSASLASAAQDERTRALERLLRTERGELRARVYSHPEDGRPLQVLVTPFAWPRSAGGVEQTRFARALFIGDPKQHTGDPIGVLHARYGLTRGETRLALLLLAGCSVEEAAQLLRISVGTARGVLKQVFDKTDTNRQPALVRLLLQGVGQIRPGTGEGKRP
jgi:DNA-binding CsgD family transcriptional regulator